MIGSSPRHTSREHDPTTLFTAAEVPAGRCTVQSTIDTANLAAALMLHQFTRWLRGVAVDSDQCPTLLAAEWSTL